MALVLTDIADSGVATVTLNDPDRRNVFTGALNAELIDVFDSLEQDDNVGAAVITGAGPHFSAGGHLQDLLDAREDHEALRSIYDGFLRIAHTSLPTVAAVNGAAVGAGMNCALACDLIVAGTGSRFDSRFLQIAIHPGGGHTWRLRNKTDIQTLKAMVLFSEVLSGPRAAEVGLAWECVPDDDVVSRAQELAAKAAAVPSGLMTRTKATIAQTDDVSSSSDAVTLELGPQAWSMEQSEFEEFVSNLQSRISSKS